MSKVQHMAPERRMDRNLQVRLGWLAFFLLVLIPLSSCVGRTRQVSDEIAPKTRLARAERSARLPGASATNIAQAGWLSWLVGADAEKAGRYFERALRRQPNDELALMGQVLLASEFGDEAEVFDAALTFLQRAPGSVLSELAVSLMGLRTGDSILQDSRLGELSRRAAEESLSLNGKAALRLRERLAEVASEQGDDFLAAQLRDAAGFVREWTVLGPLHRFRTLDFDQPSAFAEPDHVIQTSYPGAGGNVFPRVFEVPEGELQLEGEPWGADVFEALSEVELAEDDDFFLYFVGPGLARVYVDGQLVLDRDARVQRQDEREWAALHLGEGRHRIRVRFSRVEGSGLTLAMGRANGQPANLKVEAPLPGSVVSPSLLKILPDEEARAAILRVSAGEMAIAAYLEGQRLLLDSAEKAREHLPVLELLLGDGAALQLFRAELMAQPLDLPRALTEGLMSQQLELALESEPRLLRALTHLFSQNLSERRLDEAALRLDAAVDALGEGHSLVAWMQAQLRMRQGNDAAARHLLDDGLSRHPKSCRLLEARLQLAGRYQELARETELVRRIGRCPGGREYQASFLRRIGELEASREIWEKLVTNRPWSMAPRLAASDLAVAQGDFAGAERLLQPLLNLWPRSTLPLVRLARFREFAGDLEAARSLRQELLAVQGAQLSVQLAVSADERVELLQWAARDGLEVISEYTKQADFVDSSAVQVLDHAALEVMHDGSILERVHSIVQVLDKRGIDRFGEVNVPAGASVLSLRTIKADLSSLDVEHIHQKTSISMPNLEPGDFVELVYLQVRQPRSSMNPSWLADRFYFGLTGVPVYESSFEVRVPETLGLELDLHHFPKPVEVVRKDGHLHASFSLQNISPYIREPYAAANSEIFPWVEAGGGVGPEDDVLIFADRVNLASRSSPELRAFVKGLEGLSEQEVVRQLIFRAKESILNDTGSRDFSSFPSAILATGRGNRLLVIKAALDELGVTNSWVLAWSFAANPAPHRFPRRYDHAHLLLRVTLSDGQEEWLDLDSRYRGPGLSFSLSEGRGWTVGQDPEELVLPKVSSWEHRSEHEFEVELQEDGSVVGTGTQRFLGQGAANQRRLLEQRSELDSRRQLESFLGGIFPGVELKELRIVDDGGLETPVAITGEFEAKGYAQRSDGSLGMLANLGRARLGPRFLTRGQRESTLLIPVSSARSISASLRLPQGIGAQLPEKVELETEFGRFRAQWREEGGKVHYEESLEIFRNRISTEDYERFRAFVQAVDAAQNRDIHFLREGGAALNMGASRDE